MVVVRKIKSLDDLRVDMFEAIKRAYIQRGLIHRASSKPDSDKEDEPDHKTDGNAEKLEDIRSKSHDVLFEAKTFSPFPDTIRLDREKLTIVIRSALRNAKIISVPVGAMLSAEADVGPVFGSVHINSRYFVQNPYSVNLLWRKAAIAIQRLLQGYVIAHENKIDCTPLSKTELIKVLKDLGQGVED